MSIIRYIFPNMDSQVFYDKFYYLNFINVHINIGYTNIYGKKLEIDLHISIYYKNIKNYDIITCESIIYYI